MVHRKPLYTECGIYVDLADDVRPHEVIRTEAGTCYRVASVRVQVRGKNAGRQHLRVLRIPPEDVVPGDTVREIRWYPRERSEG